VNHALRDPYRWDSCSTLASPRPLGGNARFLVEVDLRTRRRQRDGPLTLPTPEARVADVLHEHPAVGTAFLVDADPNRNLNRLELVVALRTHERRAPGTGGREGSFSDDTRVIQLHKDLQTEARTAMARVDSLILTETEFKQSLGHPGLHPVQAQARRRTALVDPQRFWWLIRQARNEGPAPRMTRAGHDRDAPLDLVTPLTEDSSQLGRHLHRFGYTEMGTTGEPDQESCLELVIVAALASDEPRRRNASAVLLAKNRANPRLLAFLARKHDLASQLLGILDVLEDRDLGPGIGRIRPYLPDAEPTSVDRGRIDELLRLYGAKA
jgi:hypothetical protein